MSYQGYALYDFHLNANSQKSSTADQKKCPSQGSADKETFEQGAQAIVHHQQTTVEILDTALAHRRSPDAQPALEDGTNTKDDREDQDSDSSEPRGRRYCMAPNSSEAQLPQTSERLKGEAHSSDEDSDEDDTYFILIRWYFKSGYGRSRGFSGLFTQEPLSLMATRSSAGAESVEYDGLSLKTMCGWLSDCAKAHEGACMPSKEKTGSLAGRPLWVYDTTRQCLVAYRRRYRYAALSYVWGRVKMLEAVKANLDKLCERGAIPAENLPYTIRHAAWLAAKLSVRYLWVDSLCIAQDDEEVKSAQINEMAGIYSNAYVTLVAASGGNANAGIPAIATLQSNKDLQSYMRHKNRNDSSSGGGWTRRGWTMQELLFSRRTLLLFETTATWQCCCSTRHAWHGRVFETIDKDDRKDVSRRARTLQYGSWPDLEEYARLVHEYNSRTLTYDEDIVRAFSGVTSTFNQVFEDGILYGLPEMFFDAALLWQPFATLRRRKHSGRTSCQDGMPSWSWMGWQGQLDPRSWACGYEYIRKVDPSLQRKVHWQKTSVRVRSTVKWYCSTLSAEEARPIIRSSQTYRHIQEGDDLPLGWTRIRDSPSESPYFRHDSDPNTKFEYPILTRNPTQRPPSKAAAPLLLCRTRSASLVLGETLPCSEHTDGTQPTECVTVSLIDPSRCSSWAGMLRLNCSSKSFTTIQGQPRIETICELVEISAGSANNQCTEETYLDEWLHPERPRDAALYEFYNVLWVERVNGIAYRKALGRVLKDVWEIVASDAVNLTLG